MKTTVTFEEDNGDLIFPFPDEIIESICIDSWKY